MIHRLSFDGPLAAAACLVCLIASYRAWKAGASRTSLLCIVCFGAIFRMYMAMDQFLHPWDERYHALVAKHLIAHPLVPTLYDSPVLPYDYRDWMANHVWLHKPPLALWFAASSMAVFGVGELALRLPGLLTSILAIVLTYQIGRRVFGPRTGLLAALFHAGNGLLILFPAGIATSDHVDNLFVVLVELSVFCAFVWARQPSPRLALVAGVVTGAAVLTKLWAALFVIPMMVWLGYRRVSRASLALHVIVVLLGIAAVVAPWQIYIHIAYPLEAAWESHASMRHLFSAVEGQPTELSYYLLRTPRAFGELVYVPLGWFFVRAARGRQSAEGQAIALWILIPCVVFSIAVSKSISYLAIAAPAMFLAQAEFIIHVGARSITRKSVNFLRYVLLMLLLVLPLRFAAERLNPFEPRERRAAWADALRALDGQLPPDVVLFGTQHPIEAMFSTGCTAYPFFPSAEQLRIVRDQGRSVAVCNGRGVPSALAVDPAVLKVPCGE